MRVSGGPGDFFQRPRPARNAFWLGSYRAGGQTAPIAVGGSVWPQSVDADELHVSWLTHDDVSPPSSPSSPSAASTTSADSSKLGAPTEPVITAVACEPVPCPAPWRAWRARIRRTVAGQFAQAKWPLCAAPPGSARSDARLVDLLARHASCLKRTSETGCGLLGNGAVPNRGHPSR